MNNETEYGFMVLDDKVVFRSPTGGCAYRDEVMMTKEAFIECYEKWCKPVENNVFKAAGRGSLLAGDEICVFGVGGVPEERFIIYGVEGDKVCCFGILGHYFQCDREYAVKHKTGRHFGQVLDLLDRLRGN